MKMIERYGRVSSIFTISVIYTLYSLRVEYRDKYRSFDLIFNTNVSSCVQ